jgi:hypothetical protein
MISTTVNMDTDITNNNNQYADLQNSRRVKPNQTVGDSMTLPKDNNRMRLHMQNPNGISIGKMGDIDMILDHLKHTEVDIFVFPETNLDTHKPTVKQQVHNHFRKPLGHGTYQIEMATSNAEYTGQYKPGGILGGVIGRNRARILESGQDKYGR